MNLKMLGIINTRAVFIIRTGHSGTHWIGFSLEDHPEIHSAVETKPMFGLSTAMALNSSLEKIITKINSSI